MSFEQMKEHLLAALLRNLNENGEDVFEARAVSNRYKLAFNRGQMRMLVRKLETESYIKSIKEYDPYDSDYSEEEDREYQITWLGIQAAEGLGDQQNTIPASNRYVQITDNQRSELEHDAGELREQVRASNEASEDDRQIALYEIAVFEASIAASCVATELVERFVSRVLKWLLSVFSGSAVKLAAEKLIQGALKYVIGTP